MCTYMYVHLQMARIYMYNYIGISFTLTLICSYTCKDIGIYLFPNVHVYRVA